MKAHIVFFSIFFGFFLNSPFADEGVQADLILNQNKIATLAEYQGAYSPVDRARTSKAKIESLYELPSVQESDFETREERGYFQISHKGEPLLVMTAGDLVASGLEVSLASVRSVEKSIYRHVLSQTVARSPKKLTLAAVYVLLTLLIYFALIKFIFRLKARAYLFLEAKGAKFISRLPLVNRFQLIKEDFLVNAGSFVIEVIFVSAFVVLSYLILPIAFSFLPWTQHWAAALFNFVEEPVFWILRGLGELLPNVFFITIVVVVCRYLLRALKFFFREVERGSFVIDGFHADWSSTTYKLVRLLVIVLALVICFPYIPGSSSPAFQGITVFLGVLLSLGSSSAVANVIAGVVLTYMRPFKLGDRVKIAETVGDVIGRELLVTRVRTIKNDDITIPNATILQHHIVNYSSMAREKQLILHTEVTIGYDVAWKAVESALIEAALMTKDIQAKPEPFVFQTALNDFSVAYEINAYTDNASAMARIYSDLHRNIQTVFARRSIEIMSPNYHAIRDGNKVTIPESEAESDPAT